MADTKISAGADPVTLVGTDKVPVARSASTTSYAATMTEVGAFAASVAKAGTTTNDNAAAGQVGQYITASRLTDLALTSNAIVSLTSISLTAGDWDVEGWASFVPTAGAASYIAGISLSGTSFTLATYDGSIQLSGTAATTFTGCVLPTGATRVSIAATTTVYLIVLPVFPAACAGQGTIRARRVR